MNILPKKSWHVRTKKNIARVRKDEAQAAEEEKETQRKIALAAQEARTALLRERAGRRFGENVATGEQCHDGERAGTSELGEDHAIDGNKESVDMRFGLPLGSLRDVVQPDGHVNFFQDIEAGKRQGGTNEEFEDEKRNEQEDYEKKIGYLVYLGQDSLEHSKNKPWYAKIDRGKPTELRTEIEKEKVLDEAAGVIGGYEAKSKTMSLEDIKMSKFKTFHDPLKDIRKYLSTPGIKRKLDNVPSTSSKAVKATDESSSINKSPHKKHKKEKHKKRKHKHKSSKKKHKKRDETESSNCDSSDDEMEKQKETKLKQLRAERLQREREEKRRSDKVLAKLRGEPEVSCKSPTSSSHRQDDEDNKSKYRPVSVKQKYNSQFNPHLARQNYD